MLAYMVPKTGSLKYTRTMPYVGISSGKPGQFEDVDGCIGVNPPRARNAGAVQNVWNTLRDGGRSFFTKFFMVGPPAEPPIDPLQEVLPTELLQAGNSIVIFINGQTGQPTSFGETEFDTSEHKRRFTEMLSAALAVKQMT
ncbi:hypothetical protein BDP27DRAFT_1364785 [Rhodocollybia butyracea]|uniref:Uncharacterized protein n=1 Tax=Rhodocollybia butyracea TaxID=206335 RepID=A0A9P5PPF7_9AGAR|nr:hypothetical protein BDP27DRAFT_1364785 [Rhodocollybia butyracea]